MLVLRRAAHLVAQVGFTERPDAVTAAVEPSSRFGVHDDLALSVQVQHLGTDPDTLGRGPEPNGVAEGVGWGFDAACGGAGTLSFAVVALHL